MDGKISTSSHSSLNLFDCDQQVWYPKHMLGQNFPLSNNAVQKRDRQKLRIDNPKICKGYLVSNDSKSRFFSTNDGSFKSEYMHAYQGRQIYLLKSLRILRSFLAMISN